MKQANKEEMYSYISQLYNLPDGIISIQLKEILFDFASRLDRTENLYIFAGQLSRYVNVEITALTYRSPKELVDLSRYLISLAENRRMADMGLSKY